MEEQLINIKNTALSFIFETQGLQALEEIKAQFLGKSGKLTLAIKDIAKLPKEQRPEVGKLANEVKESIEEAIKEKGRQLSRIVARKEAIDVTLPGTKPPLGHHHLITLAIEEVTSIFEKIGFYRVKYPEVEWDWYAFEALNFPPNHPARDDWETFFIKQKSNPKKGPVILTPHTSSGQVREMERTMSRIARQRSSLASEAQTSVDQTDEVVIRMLNIAKCYRRQSDVSHTPMFHQFEGLVIDKNIAITHLKGTLDFFVRSYFGKDRKSRIRPYHFQFTEPSFEVDVSCGVCNGKARLPDGQGCKLCKEGWLEMGGAGMVHPNVLRFGGIDPKMYTGFAFGWGVERVLMMKEGIEIDDLRLLYSNNLDFLEQF